MLGGWCQLVQERGTRREAAEKRQDKKVEEKAESRLPGYQWKEGDAGSCHAPSQGRTKNVIPSDITEK